MNRLILALLLFIAAPVAASAAVCPAVPNTFVNGTVADANAMNANFATVINCFNSSVANSGVNTNITSLLGLTTPLSIGQGGTGSSTGNLPVTPPGASTSRGIQQMAGDTFNALNYGVVGDGVTANSLSLLATAVSSAANGGDVVFPCGVYKITAAPTFTVPAGKRIRLRGGGEDCTELWFSGSNGPLFNFGSVSSSFELDDMSITTDGTTYTGFQAVQANNAGANLSLEYGPTHTVKDVVFRGHDFYGLKTEYWATAFYEKNLSNINFFGGACYGTSSYVTDCYSMNGDAAAQSYSVAINFFGTGMGLCGTGVIFGDWVQGISLNAAVIVGCNNDVIVPGGGTGIQDGLLANGTQFNANDCVICVNSSTMNNVQLTNNLMIIYTNGIALKLQGTNYVITGNQFACVGAYTTNGATGIDLVSSYGNGGNISGNIVQNCQFGFSAPASVVQAFTMVQANQFANNNLDYNIGAGSTGVVIKDKQPRNLAAIPVTCDARARGDEWMQADAASPSYNGVATSGGAEVVNLICDGSDLKNH